MSLTLGRLADLLAGELHGDPALVLRDAAILRDAEAGELSFAAGSALAPRLAATRATAVLVPRDFTPENIPYIAVDDVHAAFAQALALLRPPYRNESCGVDSSASVAASSIVASTVRIAAGAKIGEGAILGEHVSVGARSVIHAGVRVMNGCRIGEDCEIFPNSVLYDETVLGDRVIVHAGCVLGAYGFGYELRDGKHHRLAQLGNVVLEDDVELGACTTIDRGSYGPTRIGTGTKIDNHVQIAHNCRIGAHNLICSQVGIAGSTTTGDYVILAGQAGLRDHIHVGERTLICAQAGVMNDVPDASRLVGSPAMPEREQMQIWASMFKLPELRKQIKSLQRTVDERGQA